MRVTAKQADTMEKLKWQLLETVVEVNTKMANLVIDIINAQVAQRIAAVRQPSLPPGCESAVRQSLELLGLDSNATAEQIRDALVRGIEEANAKNDHLSCLAHVFIGMFLLACSQYAARRLAS